MIQFDHDQLSVFGIGEELAEAEWRGVARQLLAQGLIAVEGEYGTLVLTDASGTVLRRERDVPLRKEPPKPVASRSSGSKGERKAKAAAAAAELPAELVPAFEALRAWRGEQAREQGVPAYVIFHDATLREIATLWPTSVRDLGTISGVGEKKLATYGEGVIEVLASLGGAPAQAPAPGAVPTPAPRAVPAQASATSASAPAADHGPDPDWPELDQEPEPEDWM